MMNKEFIILTLLLLLLLVWLILELSTRIVYGKYLSKNEILNYLIKNKPFTLNQNDADILSGRYDKRNSGYISKTETSILSKYYISDRGLIFRWSKYTKHIDKMMADLLDEKLKN